jgi:hypothetical protein
LVTQADQNASSSAPDYPAGTVRENTDAVAFSNTAGMKIVAHGVDRRNYKRSIGGNPALGELKEEWSVHRLEGVIRDDQEPSYVIDWLANMESAYLWPDVSEETTEVIKTLKLSGSPEGPTLKSSSKGNGLSRNCARLRIGGYEMYLFASKGTAIQKEKSPGCLLYVGNPSADFRERIRTCLSFALGRYLVSLGCSCFSDEWKLTSFSALSPYSLGGAAFRLASMAPAPLGTQFEWEINTAVLGRFVESILAHYTALKFRSLSWAYWHAVCATSHIAPVHFGAAIEALQRRYVKANNAVDTSLLIAEDWNTLKSVVEAAIPGLSAKEEIKTILTNKISDFNRAPQSLGICLKLEAAP